MLGRITYDEALDANWWPSAPTKERLAGKVVDLKTAGYVVARIADWVLWSRGHRLAATALSLGAPLFFEGVHFYHIKLSKQRFETCMTALQTRVTEVEGLWNNAEALAHPDNQRVVRAAALELIDPRRSWELNDLADAQVCLPAVLESEALLGGRLVFATQTSLPAMGDSTDLDLLRPHFDTFKQTIETFERLEPDQLSQGLRIVWLTWAVLGIGWTLLRVSLPTGSRSLRGQIEPLPLPNPA